MGVAGYQLGLAPGALRGPGDSQRDLLAQPGHQVGLLYDQETLPFSEEMKAAILDHSGTRGEALACVQELEIGAPGGVRFADVSSERISEIYLDALQWADQTTATMH